MATAVIAEDEQLMRERLRAALARMWPELTIVGVAENGVQALQMMASLKPDIAFLDIRMPGKTGLEVAAAIGDSAHVVFVTAYEEYAVKAFDNGAVDYLLKPVDDARLVTTIARLKTRLTAPPADLSNLLESLLNRNKDSATTRLKWLRASVGNQTRLINVDDVLFFQSDSKYTRVVTAESEALVRTTLKELIDGLDADKFWQVHRGTLVAVGAVDRAVREGPEKLVIHLRGHREKLVVSRQFFHLFKQN
jgi:DNA-binding LytR/AlgR family response regulator